MKKVLIAFMTISLATTIAISEVVAQDSEAKDEKISNGIRNADNDWVRGTPRNERDSQEYFQHNGRQCSGTKRTNQRDS